MSSRSPFHRKRACPICGAALPERPTGRPARYCSDRCRQAARAARRQVREVVALVLRLQQGEEVPLGTPRAGLVAEVLQTETALLRAERQAARLPGGGGR